MGLKLKMLCVCVSHIFYFYNAFPQYTLFQSSFTDNHDAYNILVPFIITFTKLELVDNIGYICNNINNQSVEICYKQWFACLRILHVHATWIK